MVKMVCGPTMKLHECAEAFRANQISIAEPTLANGIMQEKFPFAVGIDGNRERAFLIFRDEFYEWLDSKLKREAIRIDPL